MYHPISTHYINYLIKFLHFLLYKVELPNLGRPKYVDTEQFCKPPKANNILQLACVAEHPYVDSNVSFFEVKQGSKWIWLRSNSSFFNPTVVTVPIVQGEK